MCGARVYGLLSIVCCALFDVCWLTFAVRCVLCVVCCGLCCSLVVASYVPCGVRL